MSQNQSAARTQHTVKARLKSLAARPALTALMAGGMLAGSAGMAVIATVSSAAPAAAVAYGPYDPGPAGGYGNCMPNQTTVAMNLCGLPIPTQLPPPPPPPQNPLFA